MRIAVVCVLVACGGQAVPRSPPVAPAVKSVQLNATGVVVDVQAALVADHITIVDFWSESCGACIVVDGDLSVGDTITLAFLAPTLWDPLLLRGRVAWIEKITTGELPRAGVAFEHKSEEAAFALFELVATNAYDV